MRPWWLVLALVTGPAGAEMHKCEVDGRTIYQDAPCPADAETGEIEGDISVISGPQGSGSPGKRIKRSRAARAEFQRQHPCPVNGARRGPCPGWVVDHVVALACGGRDESSNMQWQTATDAAIKDATERDTCR